MDRVELLTVRAGDAAYAELLDPVRADPDLMRLIWEHSESRMEEEPGKRWWIAAVDGAAAAWCAAREITPPGILARRVLLCTDSYERPGVGRELGLYADVYAARHREAVLPAAAAGTPALTFVFAEPLARHLADGWRVAGDGVSAERDAPPHHWYRLERAAGR